MGMELTEIHKNRIFWVAFPAIATISLALVILTILPSSKAFINSLILRNSRVILAKADADITGKGFKVAVLKVQTADSLNLEIFESEGLGQRLQFVKRIILGEKRDAFMDFRGRPANLAIADIDDDGLLEIVAPAFDENLIPRLNIYKYDPEEKDFIKMGPENSRL
jgi:hypothetical protein